MGGQIDFQHKGFIMKKRKQFTKDELCLPENRAQFIYDLPSNMRLEVLVKFVDMSQGGDGGLSEPLSECKTTIRSQYYSSFTDKWFQDVIDAYNRIHDNQRSDR